MVIERYLTTDDTATDFAVDMSNVIRRKGLCGDREADLTRFTLLIAGLITYSRDQSLQVHGVADGSLLGNRHLNPDERKRLHSWSRRGLIEVVPDPADDRILEIADGTGCGVVSYDNFMDAYRTYPWIPGNRDRFFVPDPTPDGGVAVRPKPMPEPESWEISRKEEERLLLGQGLYNRRQGSGSRRELLTRLWRCEVDDCPMFGRERKAGQPLPDNRSGSPRCPTHRKPLTDAGPRPHRTQIKVRIAGTIRARFLIVAGQTIEVGRAPGTSGFSLHPWMGEVADAQVSRKHVELRLAGRELTAVDTSRNGTLVRRHAKVRNPKDRRRKAPAALTPGQPTQLHRGDAVILDEGVELVVSGREFAFDESAEPPTLGTTYAQEASSETKVRDGED
jgi:hypothetical protein